MSIVALDSKGEPMKIIHFTVTVASQIASNREVLDTLFKGIDSTSQDVFSASQQALTNIRILKETARQANTRLKETYTNQTSLNLQAEKQNDISYRISYWNTKQEQEKVMRLSQAFVKRSTDLIQRYHNADSWAAQKVSEEVSKDEIRIFRASINEKSAKVLEYQDRANRLQRELLTECSACQWQVNQFYHAVIGNNGTPWSFFGTLLLMPWHFPKVGYTPFSFVLSSSSGANTYYLEEPIKAS
ncbi:MAG TPA: hypothetical protein VGJ00_03355 [Rhabdochlamydiaceae bacterium]|jgi:hypothetical protein